MDHAETDFQPEGTAVATVRWAEREFGLEEVEIDATFDSAADKYYFDCSKATHGPEETAFVILLR